MSTTVSCWIKALSGTFLAICSARWKFIGMTYLAIMRAPNGREIGNGVIKAAPTPLACGKGAASASVGDILNEYVLGIEIFRLIRMAHEVATALGIPDDPVS